MEFQTAGSCRSTSLDRPGQPCPAPAPVFSLQNSSIAVSTTYMTTAVLSKHEALPLEYSLPGVSIIFSGLCSFTYRP